MSSVLQAQTESLGWHFQAGPASLSLCAFDFTPGGSPPCAAEAAVVLDLAGELLDALAAAGLAPGAQWQWVAQLGGVPMGGAQASWRGADAEARLSLPWPVLRGLAEAPDVPGLQWHPAPAECVLAHWRLTGEEIAALEPGGLLLLEEPVLGRLRARGEPAAAGEGPWQLVAHWESPLAMDVVMGWAEARPTVPVPCQLIEAARPDTVLARGRLVPWGTGQAFLIETT